MGDYRDVKLRDEERERVMERIRSQMVEWGLTLPDVEPLALDFGLGCFQEVGETEFWIANEEEHGYCGKLLFLFDEQTCPRHRHRRKHETFYVVKGRIRMNAGDDEWVMEQGATLTMPPGVAHSFTGVGNALVLEVSMPSVQGDSFFDDETIGNEGVV